MYSYNDLERLFLRYKLEGGVSAVYHHLHLQDAGCVCA